MQIYKNITYLYITLILFELYCTYVYICVCMYVCMYVCLFAYLFVCIMYASFKEKMIMEYDIKDIKIDL